MEDMVSEWVEEGGSGMGGQGGGAGISSYSSLLCLMDGTSQTRLLLEEAMLNVLDFIDPLELLEPEINNEKSHVNVSAKCFFLMALMRSDFKALKLKAALFMITHA